MSEYSFLNKFQRITTNSLYIKEIDGLRFWAVVLVVLHHISGYYNVNFSAASLTPEILNILFENAERGVEIFFAISGFILSYPFALSHFNLSEKPALRNFYIRRVTRLEPPYIIVMTTFFIILSVQKSSFFPLFYDYLSSIFYIHNIVYNSYSSINCVAWSLEVEIQFYIIAPFVAYLFKVPKLWRRIILISLILILPIMLFEWNIKTLSLLNYFQYFLVGYLLADIYIHRDIQLNNVMGLIGLICGIALLFIDTASLISYTIFPVLIFTFCIAVLTNATIRSAFSVRPVIIIGGMCYSIYLIHYPLISFVGKFLVRIKGIPLSVHYIALCIIILIVSAIFYLYLEKPFMNKNWPMNFYLTIKKHFGAITHNQQRQ